MFDRFAQNDVASSRQYGGLGLGLALVRNLVEAHGGSVSAASAGPSAGAQFSFWLPSGHPDSGPSELNGASPFDELDGSPAAPLVGLSLLIVEDDLEAGAMLTMILGDQGIQVQHESSVDAALDRLALQSFDLLISDIGMPGRDGYELIRTLRQREGTGKRMPAIALTAFSRDTDRDAAVAAGFDVHLGKPLQPQQLFSQILRLVSASRLRFNS